MRDVIVVKTLYLLYLKLALTFAPAAKEYFDGIVKWEIFPNKKVRIGALFY